MQSLRNILKTSPAVSPFARGVSAANFIEVANKILVELFGEGITEHATAAYIKDKVLAIACLSPVAAQEIKIRESELKQALIKQLGPTAFDRITYIL